MPRGATGCGWSCSCTCRWATAAGHERRRAARERRRCRRRRGRHDQRVDPALAARRATRCRPSAVHVARPGVDPADLAPRARPTGGELLCVAAVDAAQGHDVLLAALADARRPAVALRLRRLARPRPGFRRPAARARPRRAGSPTGSASPAPRTGADLDAAYAAADVLVLASRAETYGMVVTEALARGLPVIATDGRRPAGGARAAADGSRPGLLVPPGRPGGAGRGAARLAGRRRAAAATCAQAAGSAARRCPAGTDRGTGSRSCCRGASRGPRCRAMSGRSWAWARLARAAPRSSPSWSGGWAPARSSTGSARSTRWSLAAAVGIAVVTTVCCAWRWRLVARGLGVDLPLRAAIAAYYRSQFLNTACPAACSATCTAACATAATPATSAGAAGRRLGTDRRSGRAGCSGAWSCCSLLPSPVRSSMPLVAGRGRGAALSGALVRGPPLGPAVRAARRLARLLARRAWPGVVLASVVVVAGHARPS